MMKMLEGVMVIDLTQAYAGPFCTMTLADHGAKVIKVERLQGDQTRGWGPIVNDYSAYFAFLNRNKKGITLDLTTPRGKEVFLKLVKAADVVCENYKVGTMEKMGLGYEELKKVNPKLIYASISGFGTNGPLSSRPAYDIVAQAMSGLLSMTGPLGGPPVKAGPSIGDNNAGVYMALGVSMALYRRSVTGEGARIDVAMLDVLYSALENAVVAYTVVGEIHKPVGNIDPALAPFDSFEAQDGTFVMGTGTNKMWAQLCQEMGRTELIEDPRYNTNDNRCKNYLPGLKNIVEEWTKTKTIAEIEAILVRLSIPFGEIMDVGQITEHPQIQARNMVQVIDDPVLGKFRAPGIPLKVFGVSDKIEHAAPTLGQHNAEVLKELGYNDAEIDDLDKDGIITCLLDK